MTAYIFFLFIHSSKFTCWSSSQCFQTVLFVLCLLRFVRSPCQYIDIPFQVHYKEYRNWDVFYFVMLSLINDHLITPRSPFGKWLCKRTEIPNFHVVFVKINLKEKPSYYERKLSTRTRFVPERDTIGSCFWRTGWLVLQPPGVWIQLYSGCPLSQSLFSHFTKRRHSHYSSCILLFLCLMCAKFQVSRQSYN